MVNIYDDYKNELVEQMAYDLFRDFGLAAEKINPGHMVDVMLMLEDKIKVDVDKAEFFATRDEIIIEFVAACSPISDVAPKETNDLFDLFAQKQNIEITKKGKHFQTDNFDYLIIFFYDEFIDANEYNRYKKPSSQPKLLPNQTLLIKSEELANHILDNSDYYVDHIEIKRKTSNPIIDKVDSSFIRVPVEKLRAETNCLFYNQLEVDQEEVLAYLGL